MIAELRFYTITPGHSEALFDEFTAVSLKLFATHGITAYGPWRRQLTKGEQLVYVLEFADEQARDERWAAFRADPRWQAVLRARAAAEPHIAGSEILTLSR
ncbi:NIPSNAP family protein [Plantactinospora sp. GCM10030261]|uniref:NIPSNAP family protein n=1 Tax=Plantactinospora sp. GCM10030261 TaxID=3273420 RepID=UPI00361B7857